MSTQGEGLRILQRKYQHLPVREVTLEPAYGDPEHRVVDEASEALSDKHLLSSGHLLHGHLAVVVKPQLARTVVKLIIHDPGQADLMDSQIGLL